MPGFISAVNNNIKVSIGWTRLYYLCFLAGFAISATVFIALNYFFPAPGVKDFVMSPATRKEVMAESQAKWDGEAVQNHYESPDDVEAVEQFPKDV